jgi:hypothetical protein
MDDYSLTNDDLFALLEAVAKCFSDGHYTIFKFTTGYKIMLETPDLDSGAGREQVRGLSSFETLREALIYELKQVTKRVRESQNTGTIQAQHV